MAHFSLGLGEQPGGPQQWQLGPSFQFLPTERKQFPNWIAFDLFRVQGSDVTEIGLKRLAPLNQLEVLFLGIAPRVTDGGMQQVGQFEQLRNFLGANLLIPDNGLIPLGRLPNLRRVELSDYPNVTSDGLRHLVRSTSLRYLDLRRTRINDAAVPYLARMKALRVLHLEDTRLSLNGIAALHQALPSCGIFFAGGTLVARLDRPGNARCSPPRNPLRARYP